MVVNMAAVGALAVLMMMAEVPPLSLAGVYKVGDSAGWTTVGNVDYKQWAATKTFQLGDVIIFEYNPQFHNVMRVTHGMYQTCNISNSLETHTTGNDTIFIKSRGHHFFVCGVPGHCQSGQRVDIHVRRLSSAAAAPTPSALATPVVPVAHAPPALSPSHAARRLELDGGFVLLMGLVFAFFVASLA